MSGEHGEPWRAEASVMRDSHGNIRGETGFCADAARITACLNALDGVSTADIEAGAVRELVRVAATVLSLFQLDGYGLRPLEKALKPFAEVQRD